MKRCGVQQNENTIKSCRQLHFFLWNAAPRAAKAERELGWRPTDVREGVRRTLEAHGLLAG